MTETRQHVGLLLVTSVLLAVACSKPREFAPTGDFARRHGCPASRVETIKERSDRVRVNGCGASEVYVRECENRASLVPPSEPHLPPNEADARHSPDSFNPAPGEVGCAWSREQRSIVPIGLSGSE
ncbi:MAG: hypothetical protein JW751_04780 [Polyangiaceae bacterium]|nr:hypothetical protein [Polyangiaceae bacterium]